MPRPTVVTPFSYKTKSGLALTAKQYDFVKAMVATRGNKLQSIVDSYDIDQTKKGWKFVAYDMASNNLKKPAISEALNELFSDMGLTDDTVDKELQYVIEQKAELSPKVSAITEYNKIKGRHADISVKHKFAKVSDAELEKRIAEEIVGIIGATGGEEKAAE
jgi:hypothetical protein